VTIVVAVGVEEADQRLVEGDVIKNRDAVVGRQSLGERLS
jgi:hypothetical protein